MKQTILILLISILSITGFSQIPGGYYNGTENLTGTSLLSHLHGIIDNHTSVSYSAIWNHVQSTDKKSNGKVWDMYSDVPGGNPPYEFTFGSDQCGNYGQEGDCYNREHSFPQSWFNSGSPMRTDMFHVYPTDGYVNGQRGNYPFGETDNPTWTSQNGCKKGPSSYPGNLGIVFEPLDEYKGDFARTYFYMSTRYYGEDGGWVNNEMVDGAELKQWARNMLIEWHTDDPVSTKEINRNNALYGIQHNRNPYIDHPEFAYLIFGTNYPLPTYSTYPADTVSQGNQYLYEIPFSDQFGNDIHFSAISLPTWLSLSESNSNAIFDGTPGLSDVGVHNISIAAFSNYSDTVVYSFSVEVFPSMGINSLVAGNADVNVYPNPTNDIIYLKGEMRIDKLAIYSIDGRIIENDFEVKNDDFFDVSFLAPGFYNLYIKEESGSYIMVSFIKN